MSDKLTKEMLDALIKEAMMQEDIQFGNIEKALSKAQAQGNPKDKYKKNTGQIKTKITKLAMNDNDGTDISRDDIALAINNNDDDDIEAIKFLRTNLNQPDRKDFADDIANASMKVGKSKIQTQDEPQSVFQFDLSNAGMQDSTPTMGPALKNVFDTIGLYDDTLFGRIKKISDFSDNLIKASTDTNVAAILKSKGLLEFTRYVMVLDYLNAISKNVDAGAGAYLFETFLAALAGGNVAGKEKTTSNKMGGADFTFGDNPYARGSSKYLKSTSASSQAASGFEKQEFVHYVIAIKALDKGSAEKESSIDVEQILGFNIYYPILEVVKPKKEFQLYKAVGQGVEATDSIKTTDRVTLPRTNDYYIGQLRLVSVNGQKFRAVLDDAVKAIGGKFETAFKGFQSAFDSVAKAKESVGLYSTSGKATDGNQAITDLLDYKTALKAVFTALAKVPTGEKAGFEDGVDTSKLDENKMTELDLMVENMVKQFIKGNLND